MTAVANARPASAPAIGRPVERAEFVLLAPDMLAKLQLMIGHITAARDSCQSIIDEAEVLIAENAAEELAALVREWARGLH